MYSFSNERCLKLIAEDLFAEGGEKITKASGWLTSAREDIDAGERDMFDGDSTNQRAQ